MKLIVAISGASGVIYGIRLLEVLRDVPDMETHLVMSRAGRMNIPIETSYTAPEVESLATQKHKYNDIGAAISSGSFRTDGMIVAPCSMKSLSSIANSYSDNLLSRAADVVLKEGKRLVLVPRETPLHAGHCELLYSAARMGIVVAPPMPAFYNRPETVDDIVDHTVGRLLDLFGIETDLVRRWNGIESG